MSDQDRYRAKDRMLPSAVGESAYLTVASLMCGFAFAGFILYLGMADAGGARVVAACLLLGAFVALLYSAFACASLLDVRSRGLVTAAEHYWWESTRSIFLGLLSLMASVCVMGFTWSRWVGWTALALVVLFVARFIWASRHELALRSLEFRETREPTKER